MADCELCARPVPDVAYICHPCAHQDDKQPLGLAPRLRAAAALWPDLLDTVAGQARMAEPGPHRRGRAPAQPIRPGLGDPAMRHYQDQDIGMPTGLPFNYGASLVEEDVEDEAARWAQRVVAEHGGQPPADTPGRLRWLAGQLGWARYQRWAGDMWQALQPVHPWIENAVDRPRPRVDAGECGSPTATGPCRQRLSSSPRAAYVHCPTCRATWSATDRSTFILAAATDVLGTAAEISAWLTIHSQPVPEATIRSWAHRRRLLRHGTDPQTGAPRYRLGDVSRLAAERLSRSAA